MYYRLDDEVEIFRDLGLSVANFSKSARFRAEFVAGDDRTSIFRSRRDFAKVYYLEAITVGYATAELKYDFRGVEGLLIRFSNAMVNPCLVYLL